MGKKNTEQYKCPFCGVIIYKPVEFERHVFMKHGKHAKAAQNVVRPDPPAQWGPPPDRMSGQTDRVSA